MKSPEKMPIVGAVMTSFPYFVNSGDPLGILGQADGRTRHSPLTGPGEGQTRWASCRSAICIIVCREVCRRKRNHGCVPAMS